MIYEGVTILNPPPGVTPPMMVWMIAVIAGILAYVMPKSIRLGQGIRDIQTKVTDVCNDVTHLKQTAIEAALRTQKLEDAIVAIRESSQRSDERFAALSLKLDPMPRLVTMMEALTEAAKAIVPRTEVDNRLRATEERLARVELDMRDRRQ